MAGSPFDLDLYALDERGSDPGVIKVIAEVKEEKTKDNENMWTFTVCKILCGFQKSILYVCAVKAHIDIETI